MSKTIQLISVLEIIGGLLGLCVTLPLFLIDVGRSGFTLLHFIIVIAVLVLSLLSLVSGVKLWQGSMLGVRLSIILQAMQVPKFAFVPVYYSFYSIVSAGIAFDLSSSGSSVRTFFRVGTGLDIGYTWATQPVSFGVNLVAIIAIILLRKLSKNRQGSAGSLLPERS